MSELTDKYKLFINVLIFCFGIAVIGLSLYYILKKKNNVSSSSTPPNPPNPPTPSSKCTKDTDCSNGYVCSSNGKCIPTCTSEICKNGLCKDNKCECNTGFTGANCEYSDKTTCHGNGIVQYDGSCKCNDGWNEIGNCLTCVEGRGPISNARCDLYKYSKGSPRFLTDYYHGCYYNGNDDNCNESFSEYNGYGKMDYMDYCHHDSCSSVSKDRLYCSTSHDWYSSDSTLSKDYKSDGCSDDQTTLPPDLYID